MSTYRGLFNSKIWERGEEYYEAGRVSFIEREGDTYIAEVLGNYDYTVELILRQGTISYMDCDCPYAQDGHRCKHMAAVVMKMEAEGIIGSEVAKTNESTNWNRILNKFHIGRGFVNYHLRGAFDREFSQHLLREQRNLIAPKTCIASLKSLSEAILALNKVYDFYESTQIIETFALLMKSLKDSSMNEKGAKWAQKQLLKTKKHEIYALLLPVAYPLNEKGLKDIIAQLETYAKEKKYPEISMCLKQIISIKEAIGVDHESIFRSLQKYRNFEVVMDYGINCYFDSQQYEKARGLIEKILENPNLSSKKQRNLEEKLSDIALCLKDKQKYMEYVIGLVKEGSLSGPINYIVTLHSLYDDETEWKKDLYFFSQKIKNCSIDTKTTLYNHKYTYGLLLESIYEVKSLDRLETYAKDLYRYDPQRFFAVFYELIKNKIDCACDRQDYEKIAYYISSLSEFEGYEEALIDVLVYAKEHYSRRGTLIDTLMCIE